MPKWNDGLAERSRDGRIPIRDGALYNPAHSGVKAEDFMGKRSG